MARCSVTERFWSKVNKAGPIPEHRPDLGPCWLWTPPKHKHGYAYFRLDGKQVRAHRVSYILTSGPIPNGLHVLHHCDIPLCVRPEHLFLGTHADNMADRMLKGRSAGTRQTHCLRGHPFDEANTRHHRGRRICRACERQRMRRQLGIPPERYRVKE